MKRILFLAILTASLFSFTKKNESETVKVKCMVQLINYTGEGAYIAVSVLDENERYLKTLRMLGDDQEWFPDLEQWFSFFKSENEPSVDAITSATIAGGERSIFALEIDQSLLDSGNQLRFETAVEDQKYHETDLQIPLTSENIKTNFEGEGYIRYVRMISNK